MTAPESFYDYMIAKCDGSYRNGELSTSEIIAKTAPFIICREIGHESQPKHFIGRYKVRPWRCPRCHGWFVAEKYGAYDTTWWGWKFVGSDEDVPKV